MAQIDLKLTASQSSFSQLLPLWGIHSALDQSFVLVAVWHLLSSFHASTHMVFGGRVDWDESMPDQVFEQGVTDVREPSQ